MYAIVKNVVSPPRASRAKVDPRSVMEKKRSSAAGTPRPPGPGLMAEGADPDELIVVLTGGRESFQVESSRQPGTEPIYGIRCAARMPPACCSIRRRYGVQPPGCATGYRGEDHDMTQSDVTQPGRRAETSEGERPSPGLARELTELARQLHAEHDPHALLEKIVHAAIAEIDGAELAGVTLRDKRRDVVETPVCSDGLVRRIDEIQYETAQGPCLQAYFERQTVRSDDLATDPRWPEFSRQAVNAGVASMLAFELFTDHKELGALNLYARRPNAFDEHDEETGLLLASHASIALSTVRSEAGLRQAIDSRDLIGQAKGILMERYKIGSQQAFEMLVVASQRGHRKLREVADHLAATGELLS
jgi:hypothetical protein